MQFDPPLQPGTLVRRYKRFLADIELDQAGLVTAHCPDPGAMHSLREPGRRVACSFSDNPRRKLAWTWEIVEEDGCWVGIHTGRSNGLVAEALGAGQIAELAGLQELRREVRLGDSRLDFAGRDAKGRDFVLEVKTVTLRDDAGVARFPDAVTTRGQKHLRCLMDAVAGGLRACLLFWVNRADCSFWDSNPDIDPTYAALLDEASQAGVEVFAYRASVSPKRVTLDRSISRVPRA